MKFPTFLCPPVPDPPPVEFGLARTKDFGGPYVFIRVNVAPYITPRMFWVMVDTLEVKPTSVLPQYIDDPFDQIKIMTHPTQTRTCSLKDEWLAAQKFANEEMAVCDT